MHNMSNLIQTKIINICYNICYSPFLGGPKTGSEADQARPKTGRSRRRSSETNLQKRAGPAPFGGRQTDGEEVNR